MGRIPVQTASVFVACALASAGCEPEVAVDGEGSTSSSDPAGESSSSSTSTSSTTTSPAAESSDSGSDAKCAPGDQRCSAGGIETCESSGLGWVEEACPEETQCGPCTGGGCEQPVACLDPCDAASASSQGCSFLVSRQLGLAEAIGPVLDIPPEEWPLDGLLLLNPGEETANVDLYELGPGENEPGDPAVSLVLPAGGAELVPLADSLPIGFTTTIRIGAMTWVDSDRPIVAYSYSPIDPFVGNDSSMLLPEEALGHNYVVPSFPSHYLQHQGAGTPSYFDVIATSPQTTVRWRSEFAATYDASIPNEIVPIGAWSEQYTLSRFTGLRVVPSFDVDDVHDADMSGVVVEASGPVYVVGGSRCSAVPEIDSPNRGCDPLTEALIPLEQWGMSYAVPPPPPRENEDHHYRIYAADAGITVNTDPPALSANDYTFSFRGDYIDVTVPFDTSFSATADGPIMVVGYLASRDLAGGIGDPAMYQLAPWEQGDTRFMVGSPASWDSQYVQVVRAAGGADVQLDGQALVGWQPVGTAQEYVTALVEAGVHELGSDDPFVATQFGYNNSPQAACEGYDSSSTCNTSYAHPAGMRAEQLYQP